MFITHNVHDTWAVGDTFTVLNRGTSYGTFKKGGMTREQLLQMTAGGKELEELAVELDLIAKRHPSEVGKLKHRVAEELDREAHSK
jgi:simple sugar transport system ATP-binding protein